MVSACFRLSGARTLLPSSRTNERVPATPIEACHRLDPGVGTV